MLDGDMMEGSSEGVGRMIGLSHGGVLDECEEVVAVGVLVAVVEEELLGSSVDIRSLEVVDDECMEM